MPSRKMLHYHHQQQVGLWLTQERFNLASRVEEIVRFCQDKPAGLVNDIALCALGYGQVELAEALIEKGANPLILDGRMETFGLFHHMGFSETQDLNVLHLLALQKSPLQKDGSGQRWSRVKTLEYLLDFPEKFKPQLNTVYDGYTPLLAAEFADKHHGRIFASYYHPFHLPEGERTAFQEALIAHGAQVNPRGVKYTLLEGSIPEAGQTLDFSKLDRVLAWGAYPQQGASAWAKAIYHDQPKGRYAVQSGWGPRAQALQTRGLPLDAGHHETALQNPLYQALTTGCEAAIDQMVQQSVDIRTWRDARTGAGILSFIAQEPSSTLDLLLRFPQQHLKDLANLPDHNGNTPLHDAVAMLSVPVVGFLLDHGADPNALNSKGQTPLEACKRTGNKAQAKFEQVHELLKRYGFTHDARNNPENGNTVLHQAATALSIDTISSLLAQGFDPNTPNKAGKTPLFLALSGQQLHDGARFNPKRGKLQAQCVEIFHNAGVDINALLPNGDTLLHEAMARGLPQAVIKLLELGADHTLIARDGRRAVHMWRMGREEESDSEENKGYGVAGRSYRYDKNYFKAEHAPLIAQVMHAFEQAGADIESPDRHGGQPFGFTRTIPEVQQLKMQIATQPATALRKRRSL